MNGKLISIENFDSSSIILKPPTASSLSGVFYSEIWYLDKSGTKPMAVRPVFKTPRLPVKFGSKRFTEQGTYTYCLNMSNMEIDPEIGEFYDFVKQCDRALIAAFTEKHKTWPVKPTTCLKYRTAMKRHATVDGIPGDFYFQIKLINSASAGAPESGVATVIYNDKREKIGPEEISYGKYVDQFIWPGYLRYDKDGIHPVWQAHQIVISSMERVFLDHCILDHLYPPAPPMPMSMQFSTFPPPPPPPPPPQMVRESRPGFETVIQMPKLRINPLELKSVIKGLRSVPPQQDSSSDES